MDLNDFMAAQPKPAAAASAETVRDFNDGVIPEGYRNSTMSRTAASILKRYGDTEEAYEKYLEAADTTVDDYFEFIRKEHEFLEKRNERIKEYCADYNL